MSERNVKCPQRSASDVASDELTALEVVDPGVAGASARREHERRRIQRTERVKAAHPRLGGLILAVSDDPQSTAAWATGAEGEERVGALLDRLSSERIKVLHDRRVPGTRANIDHIVVTPGGIHVIDAKNWQGRPVRRAEGGLLRPRVERLFVGGRDRTTAVEGVLRQLEVVRTSLDGTTVPVRGYLCFVEADWPLLEPAFSVRGVTVLWPKRLKKVLSSEGLLSSAEVDRIHRALAQALSPA